MDNTNRTSYCKLHKLIKSLTKNEKGYLKKYSKIFIGKQNTRLVIYYNILDKMPKYNKSILEQKLLKHDKLAAFKNVKYLLFNGLLEDLAIMKSNKIPSSHYFIEHMKMFFLYQKGLYKECLGQFNVLEKAKDKDSSPISTLLYSKFKYLYFDQLKLDQYKTSSFIEIEKNYDQAIGDVYLENLVIKSAIHFSLLRIEILNKPRKEGIEAVKSYKEKYIETLPNRIETTKLKLISMYYFIKCSYYIMTKEYEIANQFADRYYQYIQNTDINAYIHEYTNSVLYKVSILNKTKAFSKIKPYLNEFDKVQKNLLNFNSKYAFTVNFGLHISHYLDTENWPDLQSYLNKNEQDYLNKTINTNVLFYLDTDFTVAKAHFFLGNYENAQKYLDKISYFYKSFSKNFHILILSSKILSLMIHFELGNFDSNTYFIDNLYSALKRNQLAIPFDSIFFKEFKKINEQPNQFNFCSFKAKILNKDLDERFESYLVKLNFISWLDRYILME